MASTVPAGPGGSSATPGGRLGDLADSAAAEIDKMLESADRALTQRYPGDRPGRQPVQTAYVPANSFAPELARQWGAEALAALSRHAPDLASFAVAMRLPPQLAAEVRGRVLAKLATEPVEDLRLDFEDGYGRAGDAAEDADARLAAIALADSVAAGLAPPFVGVRCKSLERLTRRRAIRTLDIFIGALAASGPLPEGFVLTLPKITSADQVRAAMLVCTRLEQSHGLADGRLGFEVQVETPQLILAADGAAAVARCVEAGAGRLTALHFGIYDYSAAVGLAAQCQVLDHPSADHARAVLQTAAAGTGVRLSDGSVNVLPDGSHDDVVAGWQLHARLVRRSLNRGFYQGWDLHPAQLASRYAATYGFFRGEMPTACARLRAYAAPTSGRPGHAAQAGTSVLDEPATVRALAGYVLRGVDCGAVSLEEVTERCGLDRPDLDALQVAGTHARA
jgi:citrate lyase beta subunit